MKKTSFFQIPLLRDGTLRMPQEMSKINYLIGENDSVKTEVKYEIEKSEKVNETSEQKPKKINHQRDEYISSKDNQPSGLYNVSRDKDGKNVISYDNPRKKQDGQQTTTPVTALKNKRDLIKMRIKSETNENKVRELKKKLKEIEKQIKNADA